MSMLRATAMAAAAAALLLAAPGSGAPARVDTGSYRDGHTRPRALAFNADDGLLYVALSTSDEVAIVDPAAAPPRLLARRRVCAFPDAIAAAPGGGVKVVSLAGGGVVQSIATGLSPRALRVVPAGTLPPLLLVSNFIDHTVTVHVVSAGGRLGEATQSIKTEAPVLDMLVAGTPPSLLLFTHEDRALDRAHLSVEGLDSGVMVLPARAPSGQQDHDVRPPPFEDPGPGKRRFLNLGELPTPAIELAGATGADGIWFAAVGAGSDNLLIVPRAERPGPSAIAVGVGANPSALAALPGGRFVTADRLSDTLSFVAVGKPTEMIDVGAPERPTPAERGELLFYSRALVPHNVATGPLSLYTCAACHDDGDIDGRRHPAKRNRFFSMTKSCRGLGTTAPYLSLGEPATIEGFADNIVTTHAQGAERGEPGFDKYPVTLRVRAGPAWENVTLSPEELRAALAAYMVRIPPEPSPFVKAGRRALDRDERSGLTLFRDRCAGCHQLVGDSARGDRIPPAQLERRLLAGEVALTDARLHAVGTPVLGDGGNNPPSLRGVWEAAPYFSDGSARTLEDVLRRTDPDAREVHAPANATRPPAFTPAERAVLIAFLRAL
jgi:mono/diheme cytochrome c family protein